MKNKKYNISELRKKYTIGCDPISDTKDTFRYKLNNNDVIEKCEDLLTNKLTYEKLKEYLLEIFNRPLPDNSTFKLGELTYDEVRLLTSITEEEYKNSTKLYWIGNAITGLKGYSDFLEMLK